MSIQLCTYNVNNLPVVPEDRAEWSVNDFDSGLKEILILQIFFGEEHKQILCDTLILHNYDQLITFILNSHCYHYNSAPSP